MRSLCTILCSIVLVPLSYVACQSTTHQEISWSRRVADSFLLRHPGAVTYDSGSPNTKWNYEQGVLLTALHRLWKHTGEKKYADFIRENLQKYVDATGTISTYQKGDYNLDNIAPGRLLLYLFDETKETRYRAAAESLMSQLREQPRTKEGGFWHKKIYPFQMWLDGLYMAEPFSAAYARRFGVQSASDDIANQFEWMASHAYDSATGLYFHGWDERREQRWANTVTGTSPSLWSRSIGWFCMALVDVLEEFPPQHPRREKLVTLFRNLCAATLKYRDKTSRLWYQVIDQGAREGNYLETSASAMFAYCYARGANDGLLDAKFAQFAKETVEGIVTHQVTTGADGLVDLHGTCRSAGLGGNPYRDGSYAYYVGEPKRTNDLKGIGAFILAAIEAEKSSMAGNQQGR